MEELIKTSVSMPCHKYMVRAIQSEEDKLNYARAFISKLYAMNHSIDDIMVCYSATSVFQTTSKLPFLSYKGKALSAEQFYHEIMSNTSISHYKSCREYLKTNPKNISTVCKMCPSYNGFTNRNSKTELAMLKFISSAKTNVDFFLQLADAKYFRTCYDLAENTLSSVPFVVPLPRLCFTVIQKCGADYFEQNLLAMSDEDRLNSLQSRIISVLRSKYKIDEVFPDYIKIFPTVWRIFVNEISAAEELTKSDVKGYIECTTILDQSEQQSATKNPLAFPKKDKDVKLPPHDISKRDNKFEQLDNKQTGVSNSTKDNTNEAKVHVDAVDNFNEASLKTYDFSPEPENSPNTSDDKPIYDRIFSLNTQDSFDFEIVPAGTGSLITMDTIYDSIEREQTSATNDNFSHSPEEVMENSATSADAITYSSSEDTLGQELTTNNTTTDKFENVENRSSELLDEKKSSIPDAVDDPIEKSKKSIALLPIKVNDIALPVILQDDLKKYIDLVTDENADFLTVSIARDRLVSLECLQDESGAHVLLIWVPIYQKFFYAYFTSLHRRIKEILAYKSIFKVCYQPYYLYSLSKIYAVPARNVFSIFSSHITVAPLSA